MKLEQLQVDSIIMDLDGTLWDSSQTCARAFSSVLEQHCSYLRVSADTLRNSMGLQDNQFADLLLKDIDEQNRYIFNGTIEILKQLEKRFNLP
ncbi:MAG: HAD hydrolase-like protein [Spirochaetales bacterium]|nr:HAD hydrolase-like protein [Spirochaetales bacterium]